VVTVRQAHVVLASSFKFGDPQSGVVVPDRTGAASYRSGCDLFFKAFTADRASRTVRLSARAGNRNLPVLDYCLARERGGSVRGEGENARRVLNPIVKVYLQGA
jgi:hypothetical protein